MPTQPCVEDIHTPNPLPARGVYGFSLYISSWCFLILYTLWAVIPTPILNQLGITYVPAKYWVILIPLILVSFIILFVSSIFLLNIYRFRGYRIFEEVEVVSNDFGEPIPVSDISSVKKSKLIKKNPLQIIMRSCLALNCVVTRLKHGGRSTLSKTFPANSVSRGSQVELIHKRLSAYERTQAAAEAAKKSNFATSSLAAETLIKADSNYGRIIERRNLEEQAAQKLSSSLDTDYELPLAAKPIKENILQKPALESQPSGSEAAGDRGYYVEGNDYVDDYVLGSTADFSYDEVAMPSYEIYGSEDAQEIIEFQLPGQSNVSTRHHHSNVEEDEQFMEEGLEDQRMPVSNKKCSGCGAQIQCEDSALPGFLPVEHIQRSRKSKSDALCRRCHLLKHYNFLLNVNVCQVDYASIMSCLRMNEEALVLLIVDITDIPGSIHRQLPHIIGPNKPMIVVANKVDLLPPDARTGYLKRFKMIVDEAIEAAGFRDQFTILHTALVSAKTGYGIEDLITEIYLKYTSVKLGLRNDIYLIGCTNAGKSSIFNTLLQSDLCKIRAIDIVERATTSIWPGTTLSLLKFPVMQPSPFRLELRRRRLLKNKAWLQKEMYNRKLQLQQSGDPKYAVLFGNVENTFKERDEELRPIAVEDLNSDGIPDRKTSKRWSMKDPEFEKGMWCYDTPGTINDQQVLNLFTLEELIHVLPRHLLRPRTAIVPVGHSLLIGGVARVDVEECEKFDSVLLTSFASDDLPLNCIRTDEADLFLEENNRNGSLVVPRGGPRPNGWPGLESQVFTLHGRKGDAGIADIVLSSIGWVLLSSTSPHIRFRCFTPGGRGLPCGHPCYRMQHRYEGKGCLARDSIRWNLWNSPLISGVLGHKGTKEALTTFKIFFVVSYFVTSCYAVITDIKILIHTQFLVYCCHV